MTTPKKKQQKLKTPLKIKITRNPTTTLDGLDLSNQALVKISDNIFSFTNLRELHLENNEIVEIPPGIQYLKNIEAINLSSNKLVKLPPEMCKCYKLRELNLSDNLLSAIPNEFGNLYNIEILNLDGNPLIEPYSTVYTNYGGTGIINFCKENNKYYDQPLDRLWLTTTLAKTTKQLIRIGTYNILSSRGATPQNYPFLPKIILESTFRYNLILEEIVSYNVDILCLQELEIGSYKTRFVSHLENTCGYESVFFPKSRIKNIPISERNNVDGCAIFWRKNVFQLLEQNNIEFQKIVMETPEFNAEGEILVRNMNKDNIATIVVFEKMNSEQIIVVNTHLYWRPEYSDIKFLQILILIREIEKCKSKYPNAGLLICGDLNSLKDSEVIKFILDKEIDTSELFKYVSETGLGIYQHNLNLHDCYANIQMELTHMSKDFQGVVDFIFHDSSIAVKRILSPVNPEYFNNMLSLPSIHLPSDHIFLAAEVHIGND